MHIHGRFDWILAKEVKVTDIVSYYLFSILVLEGHNKAVCRIRIIYVH